MEPRDDRIEFHMDADISDGNFVFDGAVSNVSRKGIMMMHIPKKFDFYSNKCIAVVNGSEKNFKLLIKPCWSKAQGEHKNIGFQIISPPLGWIRFINELDNTEFATAKSFH